MTAKQSFFHAALFFINRHRTYVYHAILDKIVRNEIVGTTNKQNVLWYYEFSLLYLGHAYSHPLQLRVEHTCK